MSKGINLDLHIDEAEEDIRKAAIAFLHEAAGELEAQVKRNTAVDTGQLKASWSYVVDKDALEARVGSPLENAIWEEFGTGEYALEGNGRKTPWKYQDAKGNWHCTTGKRPRRALHKAYESLKNEIVKMARRKFGGIE